MKTLLLLTPLLLTTAVQAQRPVQHAEIIQNIPANVISDEKAIETLVARNVVLEGAKAVYQAGKSVLLKPGFVAQAGSVFLATVALVSPEPPLPEPSTVTLRAIPNPFAERVTIEYSSSRTGKVRSQVINGSGQILRQNEDEVTIPDVLHHVQLDTQAWPAGVYYFQLQIKQETSILKLIKK